MQKNSIKLNIGCGPTGQIKGFVNLDNSPSVILSRFPHIKNIAYNLGMITEEQFRANWSGVIKCDASKRLPYKDNSVDQIYSSHFLEHIPYNKGISTLAECYRVLKNGGVFRLVLPDLLWHAENYVKETKKILSNNALPDDRSAHDKFLWTIYGAYLEKKRFGAEHCYMYDFPTIINILKKIGFKKLHSAKFKDGTNKELAQYDSRPEDSMYIEAIK